MSFKGALTITILGIIVAHLKTLQPVVKNQELFYAGFLLYNKRAKTDKTGQIKIIRSLSTPPYTPEVLL